MGALTATAIGGCGGASGSAQTGESTSTQDNQSAHTDTVRREPRATEAIAVCNGAGGDGSTESTEYKDGEVRLFSPTTGANLELRNQGFGDDEEWGEATSFTPTVNGIKFGEGDCASYLYNGDLTRVAGMVDDDEEYESAGWYDSQRDEVHWIGWLGRPGGYAHSAYHNRVVSSAFNPGSNAFWWVEATHGQLLSDKVTVVVHGPASSTSYQLKPAMFENVSGADELIDEEVKAIVWRFTGHRSTPEMWIATGVDAVRLLPGGKAEVVSEIPPDPSALSTERLPESDYHPGQLLMAEDGQSAAFVATDSENKPSLWLTEPPGKHPNKLADIPIEVTNPFDAPEFNVVRFGRIGSP